jgi:hypothetical protein
MVDQDDLTVDGSLSVSASTDSVFFGNCNGALVTNNGTIANTAPGGSAILFAGTTTLTATITNSNTIQSGDRAIQILTSFSSGTLTVTNALGSSISSTAAQALDLAQGIGAFHANVTNAYSASINSAAAEAMRFGGVGSLVNDGVIQGESDAGYVAGDAVVFVGNATGIVQNHNSIVADRNAISGGIGTVSIVNTLNGTITGNNGAGIALGGNGSVTNYGAIEGWWNSSGTDLYGTTIGQPNGGGPDGTVDGDGDGIDIHGQATVENFGTIRGEHAFGSRADGRRNYAEGIAAGGGTFTNHAGATIFGNSYGIFIDDGSTGPAPFQTTIVNDGTITGINSIANGIHIVGNHADTITNRGTITGGSGTAILFGDGNDTLFVGTGSVINGLTNGGGGTNMLDYFGFGSGATVDLAAGTATGTGGILGFANVAGSAQADSIVGNVSNNVLLGNGGNDTLDGGAGNDRLDGGPGFDTLRGGTGNDTYVLGNDANSVVDSGGTADLVTTTTTRSLLRPGLTTIERLTLVSGNINGTGNNLANIITGSTGNNVIWGGRGNDTLSGGAGNDTLYGEAGIDRLTGGAGKDNFVFNVVPTLANRDVITDFSHHDDTIKLAHAFFKGMGVGLLKSQYFFAGTHAHDADDHIIYNKASGALYYDADGTGAHAQVQFATIADHAIAGLAFSDFVLI